MMEVVFAYIVGIIILAIIAKLLLWPIKLLFKLIVNALLGGLGLILINFIGGIWGIHIGINILTALIVGVFGVPGVIFLLLAQRFF